MDSGQMVVQAGLLICSAMAIAMTTRSSLMIRRVGAIIGVLGQSFWFIWLDPMKDFGAFALAVWFLGVYGRVLYETFHPQSLFFVKVHFHQPERRIKYIVEASSEDEIRRLPAQLAMVVPCAIETMPQKELHPQLTFKKFSEELMHQQRIQQSEQVVPS